MRRRWKYGGATGALQPVLLLRGRTCGRVAVDAAAGRRAHRCGQARRAGRRQQTLVTRGGQPRPRTSVCTRHPPARLSYRISLPAGLRRFDRSGSPTPGLHLRRATPERLRWPRPGMATELRNQSPRPANRSGAPSRTTSQSKPPGQAHTESRPRRLEDLANARSSGARAAAQRPPPHRRGAAIGSPTTLRRLECHCATRVPLPPALSRATGTPCSARSSNVPFQSCDAPGPGGVRKHAVATDCTRRIPERPIVAYPVRLPRHPPTSEGWNVP